MRKSLIWRLFCKKSKPNLTHLTLIWPALPRCVRFYHLCKERVFQEMWIFKVIGWTRWILKVFSNLVHSVILWKYFSNRNTYHGFKIRDKISFLIGAVRKPKEDLKDWLGEEGWMQNREAQLPAQPWPGWVIEHSTWGWNPSLLAGYQDSPIQAQQGCRAMLRSWERQGSLDT